MYNGIINVYKEKGYTSHDVVAKLRGIVKQKKIGHTGTLDPDATGVLPVCLGNATKLCDMLTDKRKSYETVMILGFSTDTQDISGETVDRYEGEKPLKELVSDEKIRETAEGFVGAYEQLPPMYSAIKVNGRRLYELAREGKNVERKTRMVDIGYIEILEIAVPRIRMRVECSKGTYIRTLCHDIGEKLGVHGCMEELTRISSGSFRLENAYKLEEIEKLEMQGTLSSILLPVEEMFPAYPALSLKKEFDKVLQNGNPFPLSMTGYSKLPEIADGTKVRVHDSRGDFQAIYEYRMEKGMFFPLKMFLS